jgi:hypothetical protein
MLRQWLFRFILGAWFVAGPVLSAQEQSSAPREKVGGIGLVLGLYGPGLYLPVSSGVAMRFDVSGSVFSTDDFDSGSVGVGMSGLRYLGAVDEVRTYVGARIGYAFTWSTGNAAHTKVPNGSLLFGTEYAIRPRLGLFGEAIGSYSRSTGTRVGVTNTAVAFASSSTWSIGTGVGLLFHF